MSEGIFTDCPTCSGQILKAATTCVHCGVGVKKKSKGMRRSGIFTTTGLASNYIPVRQFIFLSLVTLGTYHLYWFYINWRLLKHEKIPDINPLLNTLCLFVPFYNFYLIYRCLKEINELAQDIGVRKFKHVEVTYQYIFISVYAIAPSFWSFLALLKFWPLIDVQKTVNEYIALKERRCLDSQGRVNN